MYSERFYRRLKAAYRRLLSRGGGGSGARFMYDEGEHPEALNRFYREFPDAVDPYSTFSFQGGGAYEFSEKVLAVDTSWRKLQAVEPEKDVREIDAVDGLDQGIPLPYKPFPLCIKYVKKALKKKNLYTYPEPAGELKVRREIAKYLVREGVPGKVADNILITYSVTHAYDVICRLLIRKGDVVITTGPNYGLFSGIPERYGGQVEFIELTRENKFRIEPEVLDKRIREINTKLKKEYKDKKYIPRVKFLFQMNPHNPYGTVYSTEKEVSEIAEVCLKNEMFVVDDLIYRDLVYDREKLALPIASIPKYQDITISLYGLSKSYGLASFRAAFIDAPIIVKRALGKMNYQALDAISVLQSAALEGAYNASDRRYRAYDRYFSRIMKKYEFNFYLVYGLINGADKVKKYGRKVRRYINIGKKVFLGKERKEFERVPKIKMIRKEIPESGFYVVLDFSEVLGKSFRGEVIREDHDFLAILIRYAGVKFISGSGMNHFGVEDHIYARVSFGLSPFAILQNFFALYKVLREIE